MDPFLLSYYGCLVAIVKNNPQRGIKICRDALARLGDDIPFGHELLYPVFYLNLGRAYLKGGRKKDALMVFKKGLKTDPQNSDLLGELKKLGTRKRPLVPLLKRSNTVNKYIGKLLSRLSK
jgi:tetratricopeptide (TPR) repeat protein